jgi:hypothetical protein
MHLPRLNGIMPSSPGSRTARSNSISTSVGKANGTITSVDVPKATSTAIYNINASGASVGPYADSSGVAHGFVRSPTGAISTFSVQAASKGTFPGSNNTAGSITGNWIDSNGVNHGFVRQ